MTQVFGNDYSHLDPEHIIPASLLKDALVYFNENSSKIPNKKFMSIINLKLHNSLERFYIIDMESGQVDKYLVAHGKKSDPLFTGFATKFSNEIDSNMSSLGFYLTGNTYIGSHGLSLRLDGLSSTNSNARERAIVIHAADYVVPGEKIGRSFGCPAVEPRYIQQIIDEIKDGSLIFSTY